MEGPLGGGARDLGASTINATKRRRRAHWEVLKLVIWERPPTTLINVDGGALGGSDGDPGAPTINAMKH
jgi:hypothetical protein